MAEGKKAPGPDAKKKADALGVWIAIGAGVGVAFEHLSARDRIAIGRFVREHTRGVA